MTARYLITAPGKGPIDSRSFATREQAKRILKVRREVGLSLPGERVVKESTWIASIKAPAVRA